MSDTDNVGELSPGQERSREVVITPDDCNAALDFWRHFNIPIPEDLEKAVTLFTNEPNFVHQEMVKEAITHAIGQSQHEAFSDDMFAPIKEECKSVAFDMRFNSVLEETLDSKE